MLVKYPYICYNTSKIYFAVISVYFDGFKCREGPENMHFNQTATRVLGSTFKPVIAQVMVIAQVTMQLMQSSRFNSPQPICHF